MQEAEEEVGTPGRGRRALLGAALSLCVLLAAPASGRGAVDFGNNLGLAPTESNYCGPDCTIWNTALHPANTPGSLAAPIDGVIVSFSLRHMAGAPGAEIKPIHLRVVEPLSAAADSPWRALGASSPDVVPTNSNATETFPVRVPVKAGNYVGIETYGSAPGSVYAFANNIFAAALAVHQPPLGLFGSPSTPSPGPGRTLLLRTRVEPDADADGFGDETQDKCKGKAGPNGGCPAAKKCKKKSKKKSAAAKKKCKKRRKKR